jgi:resuscitation-promoting factor RpfB
LPPPPTAARTKSVSRKFAAIGIVLALLIGIGIGAGINPQPDPEVRNLPETAEASTATIPSVVGRSIGSAERLLERAGLVAEVLEERGSNEPEGTVLGQSRAAGETVKKGYSILLVVAAPFPVKVIPNVAGDKVARARQALENEGFEVQIRREVSSRPRDTVISQSPAGGTEARSGRQVTLVVAKPAPPNNLTSEGSCTSGYSPCLPPASDYDCIGGGGDGPAYTGRVTVTGSDPYGLDSDNNGVGCE